MMILDGLENCKSWVVGMKLQQEHDEKRVDKKGLKYRPSPQHVGLLKWVLALEQMAKGNELQVHSTPVQEKAPAYSP